MSEQIRKDLFSVQQDGQVWRWVRHAAAPKVARWESRECWPTQAQAEQAAQAIAPLFFGIYVANLSTAPLMGDPLHGAWRAAGSPTCGATWADVPTVEAAENREDYIGD